MGSFNETCALSNLNIDCGTPVRLIFLTQNPYVRSDQHEAQRGCYHYDQWFARTPPIKGEYADYGDCEFKESPITELICDCFQKDVIERPFGFNQFHAGDVTKTKGIHHFLQAAWQGRLLVQDDYTRPRKQPPDSFPTWQKIHALLKSANLPLQLESDSKEGCEGYNAQPVVPGVVCVTFNSYDDNRRKLQKAKKVLDKTYDCRLVPKFKDRDGYETCLIVAPAGGFDNPQSVQDVSLIAEAMSTHPDMCCYPRELPVLSVMIREDVWQVYCKVTSKKPGRFDEKTLMVQGLEDSIRKTYEGQSGINVCEMGFRNSLVTLPFQTSVATHLKVAAKKENFPAKDELIQSCAELARIEYVMAVTHQPWYIPPLGGQDGSWALKTQLLTDILAISKKVLKKEQRDYESY